MPYNDPHHVVKTSAQWDERAIEFWVVPRGCLCVELTPEGKTKIKIGEGNKFYSQLPYVNDMSDLENYYTKEEVDNIVTNINLMAIRSTDEYDTKNDLPTGGNKLGDVRFVKSSSPSIKTDPDVYLWNGSRWIYVGYELQDIDLSQYLKKDEFHELFDPVREKVEEMYPKMHTHENKNILDRIEEPYSTAEKEKLAGLENYDDTEIRELIAETGHTHPNKPVLDTITDDSLWSESDRTKFESLHNYDDTGVRNRLTDLESTAHTHSNKNILDQVTAAFTVEDKTKLDSLHNNEVFIGTDGMYGGREGLVPAPTIIDAGKFLCADGTWKAAGEIVYDFRGATASEDGTNGLVPAPLAGEQSYYLRGDGTWAKVKQGGDKYKAGDGIFILSGEVISDTFPFKAYSKSGHLSQYIIYGNTGGVGESMGSGTYGVNISITDEHGNISNTSIILPEKISFGDYIDYEKQVFVHMRTNVSSLVNTVDPNYRYRWAIRSNGNISPTDVGAYGESPQVTTLVELEPGTTYELYHACTYPAFSNYMNLNVYDVDQNRTRTMNFYDSTGKVPTIIALGPNEKYIRLTWEHADWYPNTLIKVKAVETPITLPQIPLFPNSINTINVTNTIKPAEIYVEVAEPSEDDPDDPMSDFTGIIYNEGVLDITQEDPNDLYELTVHFRDNVDKTITIPSASVMEGATDQTDGEEGLVPAPLAGDENKFLRGDGTWAEVSGEGTEYVAGQGIEFETDSETYLFAENLYMLSNTPIDTGIIPSGLYDFHIEIQLKRIGTSGFSIICYNGYAGSFSYQPGYGRSWIYNGHESWIDLYGTATPSNSICTVDLKWGRNMTMQILPNGTYYSKTTSYDPTNVCHVLLNSSGGNESYVYYVKMWDGDTLVGDLVPCVRQSDNATGFFNKVDNTFHTNTSGPAIVHGPLTGESYEFVAPTSINAKLGNGLDFDSNDAIEVQPATTSTLGGIIVGENLTIDENGVLSSTGGGGVLYDAGDGIEFTYNHMIDMLFDRTAFLDSVTSVQRGTISKDAVTGAFTLTATGNDAYTLPDRSSMGTVYSIQADPNTTYKLTWTSDDPTVHGNVFVFENGDIITMYLVDQATLNELTFITSSTCQTLNFRFGVQNSGDSLTYSDIALYKITGDATINAKLGSGLEVDNNNDINVKLGDGLYFDADGAIAASSDNDYTAGEGIDIISTTRPIDINYIRLDINNSRDNGSGHIIQFRNIRVLDNNGNSLQFSHASSIYGDGSAVEYGQNSRDESPQAMIEGRNKTCCTNFSLSKAPLKITFTLTSEISIANITSFSILTGSDYTERDPVSWDIYASNDGATWYKIQEAHSPDVTTARSTWITNIPFVIPPDAVEVLPGVKTITAKIGDGLSFDENDAITVDEMTGASASADGASGTVPAPLIGDETKFLRGDGTWQTVSGGTEYQAGQGIEIEPDTVKTYEDLHFDYYAFKDKIQGVNNGSISFDIPNHALTISATNNYCYVFPDRESDGQLYKIPVEPNEDYLLTWEVNDTTIAGKVDVFENGDVTVGHYDPARRESAANQQFLFTTSSTAETIHIRPYVYDAGTSLTFSNFQLYHVIYDTSGKIINAKLGTGLTFDANNAIELDNAIRIKLNCNNEPD